MTTPGLIPTGEAADAVGNGVVNEPPNDEPISSRYCHVEIWLHASAQVQRPEVHDRRRGWSAGCRINGFQLPGAVDVAIGQHFIEKCCQGFARQDQQRSRRSRLGSFRYREPMPHVHQSELISTMLRAALSVKVVPTKNPLFTPTFAPVMPLVADAVTAGISLIREQSDRLSTRSNQLEPQHRVSSRQ